MLADEDIVDYMMNDIQLSYDNDTYDIMNASKPQKIELGAKLFVEVYHKPRGSGGKWIMIDEDQALRVSPKIGKHLKLIIRGKSETDGISISLIEIKEQSKVNKKTEGFQIIKRSDDIDPKNTKSCQIDLKLFHTGKVFQFLVESKLGEVLSVRFSTHNTGKIRETYKSENSQTKNKKLSTNGQSGIIKDNFHCDSLDIEDDSESPKSLQTIISSQLNEPKNCEPHVRPLYQNQETREYINLNQEQNTGSLSPHPNLNTIPQQINSSRNNTEYASNQPKYAERNDLSKSSKNSQTNYYRLSDSSYVEDPQVKCKQILDTDLDVLGVVRARRFYQYSDFRLKTNIEDLLDAMSIINRLQGKRYEWIPGSPMHEETGGKKIIGLIAQEVQQVLPEVIYEDDKGILSVNYSELAPIIITAFNEHLQNEKIYKEEIRGELKELKQCIGIMSDTDKNLEKKLKEFNNLVETAKKKIEQHKISPKNNVLYSNKLVKALIISLFLLAASIISITIVLPVTLLIIPEHDLSWTENILLNPRFEEIASDGSYAYKWEPFKYGYSLINQIRNDSYILMGTYETDTDIKPVLSEDGNILLRLGSTAQRVGDIRIYMAKQTVFLKPTQQVNFSASCNSKEVGWNTTTRFYVSMSPILSDGTEAAWESRLFYSIGNPNWESSEKILVFDQEYSTYLGFTVSMVLITLEPVVFYCDNISLRLLKRT